MAQRDLKAKVPTVLMDKRPNAKRPNAKRPNSKGQNGQKAK